MTVGAAVVMAAFFARPLLEEWGLASGWARDGLGSYATVAADFPLRPLQVLPSAFSWALGRDALAAYAAGFAVVFASKYVALRWAVAPYLTRRTAWLVATMGMVLIPWIASWRMRYGAAELSAALLFIALGAVLRNSEHPSVRWTTLGAAATALMLATYQALAVCCLAVPFVALIGLDRRGRDQRTSWPARTVAAAIPIATGLVAYGIYAVAILEIHGDAGYEGKLADSNPDLLTPHGIAASIAGFYRTTFTRAPWTLPILIALLLLIAGATIAARPRRCRTWWTVGVGAALLGLPLLAFPYAFQAAFRQDPDRVGFPVAVGFVLLVTTVLLLLAARERAEQPAGLGEGRYVTAAIVVLLLAWSLVLGHENRRNYQTQMQVVRGTAAAIDASGATSVVVADRTGNLGDVYLLFGTALRDALNATGTPVASAIVCTPVGVDRIHPDGAALGIPTTPRCEALPPTSPPALQLQVVPKAGGGVQIVPAG